MAAPWRILSKASNFCIWEQAMLPMKPSHADVAANGSISPTMNRPVTAWGRGAGRILISMIARMALVISNPTKARLVMPVCWAWHCAAVKGESIKLKPM